MEDMTNRVLARSGLKGVRVGEASNPSPPDDQVLVSTTVVSSMGIENALEFDLTQMLVLVPTLRFAFRSHRRLRMLWDPSVPDLRTQRQPEAQVAEGLLHTSVARIVAVPAGSDVPRVIRLQDARERCKLLVGIPTILTICAAKVSPGRLPAITSLPEPKSLGETSRTTRIVGRVHVQLAIHMGRDLVVPQPHFHAPLSNPWSLGPRATAGFDLGQLDEF